MKGKISFRSCSRATKRSGLFVFVSLKQISLFDDVSDTFTYTSERFMSLLKNFGSQLFLPTMLHVISGSQI